MEEMGHIVHIVSDIGEPYRTLLKWYLYEEHFDPTFWEARLAFLESDDFKARTPLLQGVARTRAVYAARHLAPFKHLLAEASKLAPDDTWWCAVCRRNTVDRHDEGLWWSGEPPVWPGGRAPGKCPACSRGCAIPAGWFPDILARFSSPRRQVNAFDFDLQ